MPERWPHPPWMMAKWFTHESRHGCSPGIPREAEFLRRINFWPPRLPLGCTRRILWLCRNQFVAQSRLTHSPTPMFSRSKKAMLAIEWIWLLIGTAAVFVHMMETWATPFLPMLWMVGVLVLFVGYRFGMALRDHYAPESDEPQLQAEPTANASGPIRYDREGAKGMVSTTDWVPPHIRGRRRREKAEQARQAEQAKPAGKLELPSGSGQFDGAEVATVFAEVDEATDPLATHIVELRPETEADITDNEIVIPSFAESTMTINEREYALRAMTRRRPIEVETGQSDTMEADKTLEREPAVASAEADKTYELGVGGPEGEATEVDKTHELDIAADADKTHELAADPKGSATKEAK